MYKSMTTEELQTLLRKDCEGELLPIDDVFQICEILASRRNPPTDTAKAFERFLEFYAPEDFKQMHQNN